MNYEEFLEMMHDITQKIPEELNNNRTLILDIVRKNGLALEYVSDALRDDCEVVETAVIQNGMALKYASKRLANLFSIVLDAVLENGMSLQFASETMRDNHEIVTSALWTDNAAIQYASDRLKNMGDSVSLMNEGKEPDAYKKYFETKLPKSGRLSYAKIKELYTEAQAIRSELHKTQSEEILNRLDTFIDNIHKISKSSSTYLDSDEVMSDLEWIKEYYKKKEWVNVTRWLSNIDSSLREMWSDYIEKIIAKKNADQNNQ